jgi:hypothetical protein
VKCNGALLLHQWVWAVQAAGHGGHIVACIGKVEGSTQCGHRCACFFSYHVQHDGLLVLEKGVCLGQLVLLVGIVLVVNGHCFNAR